MSGATGSGTAVGGAVVSSAAVSSAAVRGAPAPTEVPRLEYLHGFAGHHQTEAEPGALPRRQNSPQHAPLGLYAEQHSGSALTEPREANRRTWSYRIRPSVTHTAFRERPEQTGWESAPLRGGVTSPNRLRWNPPPAPAAGVDFLDGVRTFATCGDVSQRTGVGIHWYTATASMTGRYVVDADGELLIVPQQGPLLLLTEFGRLVDRHHLERIDLLADAHRAQLGRGAGADRGCQSDARGDRCDDTDVDVGGQESGERLHPDVAQRVVALHRDGGAGEQRDEAEDGQRAAEHGQHPGTQPDLGRDPQRLPALAQGRGRGGPQGPADEEQRGAEVVDPGEGTRQPVGAHAPATWMPIAVSTRLARNSATNEKTTVSLTASPTLFGPPVTASPR